jgi:hypothetical protein
VIAIGQVALAWNDLQENNGKLFSMVAGIETIGDSGMILTIWHSLDSDRAQRKLLAVAADRMFASSNITEKITKIQNGFFAETDKLSDARNDVIHSPLMSLTNAEDKTNIDIRVGSLIHPRAKKLSKKDILPEMRRCRDRAILLHSFCPRCRSA